MENAAVGNMRNIAFWVVLFLLIVALFQLFSNDPATMSARDSSYSDFVHCVLIGIWIFFMNRMQGGGRGGAMGFGKSKAKLLTEKHGRVTFDDVAGIDEAKEELEEIVEFLRNPQKFSRLGGKIPKGALLVGPPGTGKTLLARAIAGEAGVPFFTISGSDFVEMFVGVGASRVRDMFEQAKKNAPCIVFIDEIDAVGRSRGVGYGGGNDEREQTLNQLLVEMDGFEANEGIIIVAATNRPTCWTPRCCARAGSTVRCRCRTPTSAAAKDPRRACPQGAAGPRCRPAHHRARHAGLLGRRPGQPGERGGADGRPRRAPLRDMEDFENAKDKVMMGAERRSMVMTEDEKKLTAYHEAGHAVVGLNVPQHDPIHKATIIPRGRALGLVLSLPERDQLSVSYQVQSKIAMAMGGGGRGAEIRQGECHLGRGFGHPAGVEDRARHGHAVRLCRRTWLYRLRQRTAVLSGRLWRRHQPFSEAMQKLHRREGQDAGRRRL
jgi:cell division protease FtsH